LEGVLIMKPPISPPGWIHDCRAWTITDLRSSDLEIHQDVKCDSPGCDDQADVKISQEYLTIDSGYVLAISYWCHACVETKGDPGGDNHAERSTDQN